MKQLEETDWGKEEKKTTLEKFLLLLLGDVLSRRKVGALAERLLRGGPLVFEGWSDDSGMLFVYKVENKAKQL